VSGRKIRVEIDASGPSYSATVVRLWCGD